MVSEIVKQKILLIRGQKVMLDSHLAKLYGVETKTLKRAVKRNRDRFPGDFMFELTKEESDILRYQFGTLKRGAMRSLCRLFSLNKGSQCSPPFSTANGLFRSISRSCAHSYGSGKSFQHIRTSPASWKNWRRSTMSSSELCLKLSGNLWRHRNLHPNAALASVLRNQK